MTYIHGSYYELWFIHEIFTISKEEMSTLKSGQLRIFLLSLFYDLIHENLSNDL